MPAYTPPLRDMRFVMHEVLDVVAELKALPPHADIDAETIDAVLRGRRQVRRRASSSRSTAAATRKAARSMRRRTRSPRRPASRRPTAQFVEGGWPALSCDPAYGGQGLPHVVNQSLYEMLNSANQAWTMYPGLSHGAYEALHAHGTEEQKRVYLPKLTSGEWTGTMCLTEPHCGTDLGMLRTQGRAAGRRHLPHHRREDLHLGRRARPGREHRPPGAGAPARCAGGHRRASSLFLVPKFLVADDGSLGERNAVCCGGLEHKMGIHGNATAQIVLDGAIGTLVGAAEQGPGRDVRDDERGAARRRHAVARPDRGGLPERRGLRQGAPPDALAVGREGAGAAGRSDHRPPRRAARCCSPRAPMPRAAARWRSWTTLQLDKELASAGRGGAHATPATWWR